MMWKSAEGTSPGLSRTTLRYFFLRLLRPSSVESSSGLADAVLDEAVPVDPAAFLGAPELRPDLRAEPVEQVEERRAVAAHEGAAETEGLAAGVGEDAGGDALCGASALVLVHLVADEAGRRSPSSGCFT